MCSEESMDDTEQVIIPREITQYLKDALSFFFLKDHQKYIKKVRSLPKNYAYKYSLNDDDDDDLNMKLFQIGCVQLSSHDIYLHKHVLNMELDSPIRFDYRCSSRTEYEYKLFVFIPYLGKDGQMIETEHYEQRIDTYIDIYGKYSYLKADTIDFSILKSLMLDYQNTKSILILKTDAKLDFDDTPPFDQPLEEISSTRRLEGESKFHVASYFATMYESFLAIRNVERAWKCQSKTILIQKCSFDTSDSSPFKDIHQKYFSYFFNDDDF